MLHYVVHDDDVFAFQLCREGVFVHEYDSNPSCFDTGEPVVRPPPKNDFVARAEFLLKPDKLDELKRLLAENSRSAVAKQGRWKSTYKGEYSVWLHRGETAGNPAAAAG